MLGVEARMVNKTYVFSSFLEFRSLEEKTDLWGGRWGWGEQFHDRMLPRAMAYTGVLKPLVLAPIPTAGNCQIFRNFVSPVLITGLSAMLAIY